VDRDLRATPTIEPPAARHGSTAQQHPSHHSHEELDMKIKTSVRGGPSPPGSVKD